MNPLLGETTVTSHSPFRRVTSALTARAFLEPLGPALHAQMSHEEAESLLMTAWEESGLTYDPPDRVSLVYDQAQLVGWYSEDMFDPDLETISQVMRPIHPDELVSAETTVLKLVRLVADSPRTGIILFVLDENAIVGTLSPNMFRTPLFRLCLFTLTLELESAALSAALHEPLASWNTLSDGRREKAMEVYNKLHSGVQRHDSPTQETPPLGPLLAATLFVDKGTIVAKRGLLAGWTRSQIESLFAHAERVRNWCAHTRDDDTSPLGGGAKSVAEFVEACSNAIAALETVRTDSKELDSPGA